MFGLFPKFLAQMCRQLFCLVPKLTMQNFVNYKTKQQAEMYNNSQQIIKYQIIYQHEYKF